MWDQVGPKCASETENSLLGVHKGDEIRKPSGQKKKPSSKIRKVKGQLLLLI